MLRLPPGQRSCFKAPFGVLFLSLEEVIPSLAGKRVYSVGDVVTARLIQRNIMPDVAIIDGHSMRIPCNRSPAIFPRCIRVKNPAGSLTDELINALDLALADPPTLIYVEGEEDLTVIPLVIAADEGGVVLYGQPGEGVVVREVDGLAKRRALEMLALFERIDDV
jgi:uncharacterized protein (UPF0218 family)